MDDWQKVIQDMKKESLESWVRRIKRVERERIFSEIDSWAKEISQMNFKQLGHKKLYGFFKFRVKNLKKKLRDNDEKRD